METAGFVESLEKIRQLSNNLLDRFQETTLQDPTYVRKQIVYLKDTLEQVEEVQCYIGEFHERLDQLKMRTKIEYEGLCEFHSSPLIAFGDTALSHTLGFMDEEDLVQCEGASVRWKEVIQSHGRWQKLAEERNRKEQRRHRVTYSGEKCRVLGKRALEAKLLEKSCRPLPSAEIILRREVGAREAFVRLYWKKTNRVIWQGLIFDELVDGEVGLDRFWAGTALKHSPLNPCFDWVELTEYQSWLRRDGIYANSNEEQERLKNIFGEWDFSITILWGDEPILIAEGIRSIQHDADDDCNIVTLCTQNDVEARIAILDDAVYLELYKEQEIQ
jgi:hypothetical protein